MAKTRKAKPRTQAAASLTVYRPDEMTPEDRADLVKWLRQQVLLLLRYHDDMGAKFSAVYMRRKG